MENEMRIRLITAIDEYNELQEDENKQLDVYEVMDSLNDFSDQQIEDTISEINLKIDELEN